MWRRLDCILRRRRQMSGDRRSHRSLRLVAKKPSISQLRLGSFNRRGVYPSGGPNICTLLMHHVSHGSRMGPFTKQEKHVVGRYEPSRKGSRQCVYNRSPSVLSEAPSTICY